jgi:hypothetical protein
MTFLMTVLWALALATVAALIASGYLTIATSAHSVYWDYLAASLILVLAFAVVRKYRSARYFSLAIAVGCLLIDGVGILNSHDVRYAPGIALGILGVTYFLLGRKRSADA